MYECDYRHPRWGRCEASHENHYSHQFKEFDERGQFVRPHTELNKDFVTSSKVSAEEFNALAVKTTRAISEKRRETPRERDLNAGLIRKDEKIGQVLSKTPDWYKDSFREHGLRHARRMVPFTSEEITSAIGFPSDARGIEPGTEEAARANNGVGALMNDMAKKGWIRKAGTRTQAARPNQNAAEVNIWIGTGQYSEPSPEEPSGRVLWDMG